MGGADPTKHVPGSPGGTPPAEVPRDHGVHGCSLLPRRSAPMSGLSKGVGNLLIGGTLGGFCLGVRE